MLLVVVVVVVVVVVAVNMARNNIGNKADPIWPCMVGRAGCVGDIGVPQSSRETWITKEKGGTLFA